MVAAAPATITPASSITAPPATSVAIPQAQEVPLSKAPAASQRKKAIRQVEQEIPASPPVLPPPLASGVPPDYLPPPPASGIPPDYVPPPDRLSARSVPPPCADCGVIANVRQVTHEGQGSGAGAIIGGLAGGALANNVARGGARTLATVAGALGGGLLGNSIEKSQHRAVGYEVTVRLEDGATRMVAADTMPSWRIGDKVKVVGGTIVSR